MATSNPLHKFAVLFSGSTGSQYLADMQKVYDTLTGYYGYDPGNILVVFGTLDAGWAGWTSSPFTIVADVVSFQHAYYNFVSRSGAGHDLIEQAQDDAGVNDWNTMVLFVTGKIDNSGTDPEFLLREADPGVAGDTAVVLPFWLNSITETDLARIITGYQDWPPAGAPVVALYLAKTSLHIIVQCDRAFFFRDALYNNITFSQCVSFTFSTGAGTVIPEIATGSAFTEAWTNGLKLIPDGGGIFADQADTAGVEPTDNFIVSARKLAKYVNGDLSLFDVKVAPGVVNPDDLAFGKPKFWIKDGDEHTPPRAWWESPDIWITSDPDYPEATSEDNDYYVYDATNYIHVRFHVRGCHPVRYVEVGAKVFRSGGGGAAEPFEAGSMVPVTVLKPGDTDKYTFDYDFPTGYTHRCIRARIGLTPYVESDLDEDVDWNPHTRSDEAQRNTDPSPLKKKSADTDTATGEANIDEQAPEQEAAPADGGGEEPTDTKSTDNLRGTKEHIYVIRNTSGYTRDFIYRIDPVLFKRSREFYFSWSLVEKPGEGTSKPLKPLMDPVPHLRFTLKPREEVSIINHIGIRKEAKIENGLRLNFEIAMGNRPVKRLLAWRLTAPSRIKFIRYAGVTMRIEEGSFNLEGVVKDGRGNPVPGIFVVARSLDTRQSAVVRSGKKGEFAFRSINPDSYRVYALNSGKPAGEKIVNGFPVGKGIKRKPVVIVLE